jgi:hypothetical protein
VAHSSQVSLASLQVSPAAQGLVPSTQPLLEQVSAPLQKLSSSQSAAVKHSTHSPSVGLQTPFEQATGVFVHAATAAPLVSTPFEQVSVVHSLLSSHAVTSPQGLAPWQPVSIATDATTNIPLHRAAQRRPFIHPLFFCIIREPPVERFEVILTLFSRKACSAGATERMQYAHYPRR